MRPAALLLSGIVASHSSGACSLLGNGGEVYKVQLAVIFVLRIDKFHNAGNMLNKD